jgi:type IV pilus assembly protein PilA
MTSNWYAGRGAVGCVGFTLIELMIVVAIMGIMATMALPSYQDRVIRTEISEGMALATMAQHAIAAGYAKNHSMPKDNVSAGLPPAQYIMGSFVTSVTDVGGAITITYGNRANRNLAGKTLTLRPAVVANYPQVPPSWVCGLAKAPDKMSVLGDNQTNIPIPFLPLDCLPN